MLSSIQPCPQDRGQLMGGLSLCVTGVGAAPEGSVPEPLTGQDHMPAQSFVLCLGLTCAAFTSCSAAEVQVAPCCLPLQWAGVEGGEWWSLCSLGLLRELSRALMGPGSGGGGLAQAGCMRVTALSRP